MDCIEILQGMLVLIILRAPATMGPQHAYGGTAQLEQVSEHPLTLNQMRLYALVRLEQRGCIKATGRTTENNCDPTYSPITKAGTRALETQTVRWRRLAGLVDRLQPNEP
jgi:DNA-binding PadR family transcriptional regulator